VILRESIRRFVEEADRGQRTLLPECLDDFIGDFGKDNGLALRKVCDLLRPIRPDAHVTFF
jgi:hypothetical protein